ncbi:hypothetical protein G9A89_006881 [Geosiphon pyriformis]|nr:hypothetical protein G9A89_006881 [Geosiphon pyriformis]
MGSLESKMVALEASVNLVLAKGKLLVIFLGLYAGASSGTRFGQVLKINSLIAKTVNSSIFVVLNEDFNKNESERSASFKFYRDLGLVNSFADYQLINSFTWKNSKEVEKTIDYIFVSKNLSSAVAGHQVCSVSDFFDTNHNAILVLISLGGDCTSAKLLVLADKFSGAKFCDNIDAMWAILEEIMVALADKCLRNKHSSRFFGLKMLVAKVVRKFSSGDMPEINRLTYAFNDVLCLGVKSVKVFKHLSLVHKGYRKSKMHESKLAEEASIKKIIVEHIENFCSNKSNIIQSILKQPFHKIVLDYLMMENELVLELEEVKLSYTPLVYVRNDAFSGVMCTVSMNELLSIVGGLPNSKAIGLSGIPNKLWKHNVLKDMSMQSPVFAVGSVVEDALEKNKEIWLVLQDMQKVYDLVGWHHLRNSLRHIKMYKRFIKFFGSIHENRVKKVMTDFGLSDGYRVHNDSQFYYVAVPQKERKKERKKKEKKKKRKEKKRLVSSITMIKSNWSKSLMVQGLGFPLSGSAKLDQLGVMNILGFDKFSAVKDDLHNIWSGSFEVFTDGFLREAGFAGVASGAAAYFLVLDLGVGVSVHGLVSFTMAKLQTITLSLKCIPSSSTVFMHLDTEMCEHFLVTEDTSVSGNAHHFIRDIFWSVCHACWEAGLGRNVIPQELISCVNWAATTKAVHRWLPVVVRKKMYNKCYPGVLCLLCDKMEFSDHAFTCAHDIGVYDEVLVKASAYWSLLSGNFILFVSAIFTFEDKKKVDAQVVDFVKSVVELHYVKTYVFSVLSDEMIKLLGVIEFFAVSFGHCEPCSFFSGLSGVVQINIEK